eukprot:g1878.t1
MRPRAKKVLKLAKGYRGRAKNCYRLAINRVEKGLQYKYRDRRNKKREERKLWIQQINAGVREHDMSYSKFQHGLGVAGIDLNRKVLADMAANEPYSFKAVVDVVKLIQGASALESQSA